MRIFGNVSSVLYVYITILSSGSAMFSSLKCCFLKGFGIYYSWRDYFFPPLVSNEDKNQEVVTQSQKMADGVDMGLSVRQKSPPGKICLSNLVCIGLLVGAYVQACVQAKVFTPRRACAKQVLCDRVRPFIYLFIYLSLHKTVNLSKHPSMATDQ